MGKSISRSRSALFPSDVENGDAQPAYALLISLLIIVIIKFILDL